MTTHVIDTVEPQVVNDVETHRTYRKKKAIYRINSFVWYIVGIIEVLLLFRFVFELIGANQYSGFTNFIYTLSYPFAYPFAGILRITYTPYSFVDWSLIIAAAVYVLIGWGITELLRIIKPVTRQEVQSVDTI